MSFWAVGIAIANDDSLVERAENLDSEGLGSESISATNYMV